jgi:hypothetical protein
MHAEVDVGQSRPAAPPDPAAHHALGEALQQRGAIEREFGRWKHEWVMLPLRVRGLDRVALHADFTILAKLGCALAKTRALAAA